MVTQVLRSLHDLADRLSSSSGIGCNCISNIRVIAETLRLWLVYCVRGENAPMTPDQRRDRRNGTDGHAATECYRDGDEEEDGES